MLGASKRLLHLNTAGRRFCQRSISIDRVLPYRLLVTNSAVHRGSRLYLPVCRKTEQNFVTLSGAKFDAVNVEEAGIAGANENIQYDRKNQQQDGEAETLTRRSGNNTYYRYREEKFKNYSNSDFYNAETLRKEFQTLMENPDAKITPVTAYQFIRNCGNKMAAETAENRISLVMEIWEKLKERGIELETTHYNALLSVYIQNRHSFSPLEFLADMQESKIQPDKSTYMLIVQAYCHEGDLSGALRVVDFMIKQDIPVSEPIYTALVTGHCKNNDMEGAHKILSTMRESNITPQVDTYTALIAGHAANGDLEGIDKVFVEMNDNGISTNTLLYVNLLDSFCRHGHSSLLPEGLKRIKHKAPIETEMRYFLQRLITRGDYESAVILAKNNEAWLPPELVSQDELSPLNLIHYRLVRTNKSLDEMIRAARVLEAHGLTKTPLEDILDICHSRKLTDDAIKMLDMLRENERQIKPHYVYPILAQLAEKEDLDGIMNMLHYMSTNNIKIDPNAFEIAAKAFKKVDTGRTGELMEFAKEKGLRLSWRMSNENLDTVLDGDSIEAFLELLPTIHIAMVGTKEKSDRVAEFLKKTFDANETPKAIIALDQKNLYRLGWVLSKILEPFNTDDPERAQDAFTIFNTLVKADAMKGLNTYCYTLLLNIFFKNSMKDEFFQVVDTMKEQRIEPNDAQYFIMLKMSSLIGNSAAAQFCFDKLNEGHEPTEAEYNALLISYGKDSGKGKVSDEPNQQYTKKIISLYEEMEERELKPLGLTISQVLVAYISMGKLEEAEELRRRHGLGVEYRRYAVYNEYLRWFSKQGKAEEAEEMFKEMKESRTENLISLFSYNQLIGAHKSSGNIGRVLEIIDDLQEYGFTPNRITISEVTKCYMRRGEPEKALPMLEEIVDNGRLPSANVLTSLAAEFFERSDVESCERAVALIRRKDTDEWGEQRLKHVLLMIYLKVNNLTAAQDIVEKDDFRLTQRLIMAALGSTYKDVEFLLKVKNFLRERNLNYFLMDLSILNAYIAQNDADAALKLYEEKKYNDTAMTNYFLRKLSNFLSASGREVPFDTSIFSKKRSTDVIKEELKDAAEQIEDKAVELNEAPVYHEDTLIADETPKHEKE